VRQAATLQVGVLTTHARHLDRALRLNAFVGFHHLHHTEMGRVAVEAAAWPITSAAE
jgi:hypothetical protein